MAASDHLNPDQFVTLHRGVGDWNAHSFDGRDYKNAEDWYGEHKDEREGFGRWWSGDEHTARFYGLDKTDGLMVTAKFPRSAVHDPSHSTGYLVDEGTPGEVQRVLAMTNKGEERVLPHRKGFSIQA